MEKSKKPVILLLAVLLLIALGGCRRGEPASSGVGSEPEPKPAAPPEGSGQIEPGPESPQELRLLLPWSGDAGSLERRDRVEQALIALAEPAAGMPVTIAWAQPNEVYARLGAADGSGESFDLCAGQSGFHKMQERGLLLPVTAEELAQFAPAVLEQAADYLPAAMVREEIYGFPLYRNNAEYHVMAFDAAVCQAVGYTRADVETMTAWDQVEQLIRNAQKYVGEGFIGLANTEAASVTGSGLIGPTAIYQGDTFADAKIYDNLGDRLNLIGAYSNGLVFKVWETAYAGSYTTDMRTSAIKAADRIRGWALNGWFWPDSYKGKYKGDPAGIFARLYRVRAGESWENSESQPEAGRYAVTLSRSLVGDGAALEGYFVIPAGAAHPEAALRVLDLIYDPATAGTWADLLVYGVRDRDYVVQEDGRYAPVAGNAWQNVPLGCSPLFLGEWITDPAGSQALRRESMASEKESAFLGFSPDLTDRTELQNALRTIMLEYVPQITWGHSSEEGRDSVGKLKMALDKVGYDEYLALFQNQLDAWLADQ